MFGIRLRNYCGTCDALKHGKGKGMYETSIMSMFVESNLYLDHLRGSVRWNGSYAGHRSN
jgi:hypothetical protein